MPTAAQLEQQYQAVRSSRPKLETLRTGLEGQYGLTDRQKQLENVQRTILGTEKLLEGVPTRVNQRSRQLGGPITEGIRQQLTQTQQTPLIGQIKDLTGQESNANIGLKSIQDLIGQKLQDTLLQTSSEDQDWQRRIAQALAQEDAARQERLARASLAGGGYQGLTPDLINAILGKDTQTDINGNPIDQYNQGITNTPFVSDIQRRIADQRKKNTALEAQLAARAGTSTNTRSYSSTPSRSKSLISGILGGAAKTLNSKLSGGLLGRTGGGLLTSILNKLF